ncbi:MAG: 1-(5-phosphoribosyl)-5-[(5-phosphoribosylamino)methylideneamino]imidazole-4-carboxamide isomerase [Bacteroidetes bacterium GWF2_41_61]|nr:MAG: 1-(5-phosphoribosyl)-5-[(5-phosphoribosylamino)methylideneamino]imidazole-4-carboxamide isomerase [Bacteroidetes bacterium GWE2_40_15]OFY29680.1 MAG: 1-(5-phosphoribosyl)-5-[(5-phosphoribosylamino)methylideneamino]imidazole-4-carboxamide isomerase [Bacteroidetes bacterium GWF2_41_61]OFY89582.1 MAG: 1-(5-phosphoribosyl)-5-[(5-phosphoribosylamino)methylideneamino]imidazole-4-carboxamide isomerase [Bacteroidetes bacterium RIFOXYA12_FULL_40_10]HBG24961.1 1-(5-phosphoribosyl)-5-[(5-phosphorib
MINRDNKNKFLVIPAIDIIAGECVRLSMGDYSKKIVYGIDPLEVALNFERLGFKRLHMVDLDGAGGESPVNLDVLERVSNGSSMEIQFGGGVKSLESAARVFGAGASRVICGSIAVEEPSLFEQMLKIFGSESIILGVDVREGKVAIKGWKQECDSDIFEMISNYQKFGMSQLICTDISKDGMLKGPAFEIYSTLKREFPGVEIIASGGVSSLFDITKLKECGADGVVVGKALYEKRVDLKELSQWLQNG